MSEAVLLLIYLFGQALVALVAPLVTYFLTKPHLDHLEAKTEATHELVNGQAELLRQQRQELGYQQGREDQKRVD